MPSQYDAFAQDFSHTRTQPWPEFSLVQEVLKHGDRVLDLGCGNGRLRTSLDARVIPGGNYYGLDISEELLRIARGKYPHDHFFHGDFACELPFGKENFEVVTAIASFHHLLTRREQLRFLEEVRRVLKPGGYLFLTTWKLPRKFFWGNVLHGRWKNWLIPFGVGRHPRVYRRTNTREVRRLLQKTGFDVRLAELKRDQNYVFLARKS